MGSKCSTIQLEDDDIADIHRETGFSPNQIKRLYSRFSNLDKEGVGLLRREDFLRIPELAINPLGERIVDSFFEDSDDDANEADEGVNFKQFVTVLAHFRPEEPNGQNPLNTREDKLKFAFKIYDVDEDGYISRDEILALLRMMVGVNIDDDQLALIADRTIQEADDDKDGFISYEEFSKMMAKTDFQSKMSIRFLS